jgi:hypothetical protein
MSISHRALMAAVALAIGATFGPARASAQSAAPAETASIAAVAGDVTIVRGDTGAQLVATPDTPLLPGDFVSTGGSSAVAVQLGRRATLRLASDTQVRIIDLSPNSREVQLAAGSAELDEASGARDTSQIDTPSLTVRPAQGGDYQVTVASNGQTVVTVRSGSASVTTGEGTRTLTPGSTINI